MNRYFVLSVCWDDGWHDRAAYRSFENAMHNAEPITVPVRISLYNGDRLIEVLFSREAQDEDPTAGFLYEVCRDRLETGR